MKILIISGFLGAGKTTFIKTMARTTGRSFVIYENEYGSSSVDTKILENEDLSVWESTEKCVCCTGKGDFAKSIITISATLDPDFLIVEPTGIANLLSILSNIKQIEYEKISVSSPVTIADGINWKQQRASMPELWDDQIRGAGTVVISKTPGKSSDNSELVSVIKEINGKAEIIEDSFDSLSIGFFGKLLDTSFGGEVDSASENSSGNKLTQLTVANSRLKTPAHLAYILDLTVMGAFGKISRAKGFMPCGTPDEWIKFDLVEREWAITGMETPDSSTESVAVFIGENLQKDVLHDLLSPPKIKPLGKRTANNRKSIPR